MVEYNSHVLNIIDWDANSTIHQKEIFNSNSLNHTYSIMEFLYKAISLSVIYLYGNIYPDLSYIHIYLMAL